MPASKKPRKKYRPRPALRDPAGYAVEGVQRLTDHGDYYQSWLLKNHAAADMLVRGQGTAVHLDTLLAAHNITCALVSMLGYPDDTGVVPACETALLDLGQRASNSGSHTMRASEIAAVNNMISLHDEFLSCITVKQMEDAIAFAKKAIAKGKCERILA